MTNNKNLLTKTQIGVYKFFSDKADAKYFLHNSYDIILGEWRGTIKIEDREIVFKLDEEIRNTFEGKTKEYAVEHLPELLNKFSLSLN